VYSFISYCTIFVLLSTFNSSGKQRILANINNKRQDKGFTKLLSLSSTSSFISKPARMRSEIDSAAGFISSLLRSRKVLSPQDLDRFVDSLRQVLLSRYCDHWFPDKPCKGSAFRCIRIVKRRIDPVLAMAALSAGIDESSLLAVLPSELTLWVDPNEVCYRIGEDGSIGSLFTSASSKPEPFSSTGLQDCRQEMKQHSEFVERASTVIAV